MILSRPVKPRASRTHDIVASVPLLTIRTFSIEGTQRQISSAISTSSGFGMPKLTPRTAASRTASITTRGRMPENRRSPGADVIDVFVAIDVPDVRAFRALDEKRLAPDRAKGAHRGIHAAGNSLLRFGEKFELNVRSCVTGMERSTSERRTSNVEL